MLSTLYWSCARVFGVQRPFKSLLKAATDSRNDPKLSTSFRSQIAARADAQGELLGYLRSSTPGTDWVMRSVALQVLAQLGERAAPGVPDLIALVLLDNSESKLAVKVLKSIGLPAVTQLIARLKQCEGSKSCASDARHLREALAAIGDSAVPVLLNEIRSTSNSFSRSEFWGVLSESESTSTEISIGQIARVVREFSSDESARYYIAKMLFCRNRGLQKEEKDFCSQLLLSFLDDPRPEVRDEAAFALVEVNGPYQREPLRRCVARFGMSDRMRRLFGRLGIPEESVAPSEL